MQPVSIPMTQKDKNNNITEYRVIPLIFEDARFKTIMEQLGKDLRTKFMKLYKKTPDAKSRTPAIEMSSWLAVFAAQQLATWYSVLIELGQKPDMAAMNTFKIFGDVFEEQAKAISSHVEYAKNTASAGSESDSDVPEDAKNAPEEVRIPPDIDSGDRTARQEGKNVHGGKSVDTTGEVSPDARSETASGNSVDDNPTFEGD